MNASTATHLISSAASVTVGALKVPTVGAVTFHGQPVKLSAQERRFLAALVLNAGRPVPFAALMLAIAASPDSDPEGEILKALAYKIRRKLRKVDAAHGIQTYVGTGYGYAAQPRAGAPASVAVADGESFHKRAMTYLDANTMAGDTPEAELHYAMREALRVANMAGAPIQDESQWAEATHLIVRARRMVANLAR